MIFLQMVNGDICQSIYLAYNIVTMHFKTLSIPIDVPNAPICRRNIAQFFAHRLTFAARKGQSDDGFSSVRTVHEIQRDRRIKAPFRSLMNNSTLRISSFIADATK